MNQYSFSCVAHLIQATTHSQPNLKMIVNLPSYVFLSLGILISCNLQDNKTNLRTNASDRIEQKVATDLRNTFTKVKRKGILIGDNLKLFDQNLVEINDVSPLNEQFVEITEISHKYYKTNPSDDYCKDFKYVKITTKDYIGYVNGTKIYQPIKHIQNKNVEIDNNEVSFIVTTDFGIGVSDEDGLTFCSVYRPVIFSDRLANYEGLLKMVKNTNYSSNYPYFELKDDDMANDEILSIESQADKYIVKIKRTYQEGAANLSLAVYEDMRGIFVAEITAIEPTDE